MNPVSPFIKQQIRQTTFYKTNGTVVVQIHKNNDKRTNHNPKSLFYSMTILNENHIRNKRRKKETNSRRIHLLNPSRPRSNSVSELTGEMRSLHA